ncbi:replicase helicase endonuclease [Labeo rohita]|uniref:Replicase helicase endonuclease n=1 Tax=Labeo rohita TaxID=84645 RepID=A0A498M1T0_LABRO|nr:replicase helicase endonuclease [Labeo rohita]
MHSEYKDILISEAATFEFLPDNDLDDAEEEQEVVVSEQDDQNVSTEEKDELTLDTSMQPLDIGQDLLSFGEGIFSIAPAQGKKPVGFFRIPKLEAMAFPVQFCTGQNTIDEAREVALSPSMYFNARLFCVDTRFAKDQSYLFFAQFVTETHMVRNTMSIQLRKGKPVTRDGHRISNKLLQDDLEVERLVHSRDATSCIMYMLSYISKPEHEMNDFLKTVIKGIRETNVKEEDEMKHKMQAYSKHWQVSAQESVARTCSLPMKKCSRSVVLRPLKMV